jgi:hypothetical protein
MVHCADPPPNPVIRNSFGLAGVVPNSIGASADGTRVNRGCCTATPAPAPVVFCQGVAFAGIAVRGSNRQSIIRMNTERFTPFPLLALLSA